MEAVSARPMAEDLWNILQADDRQTLAGGCRFSFRLVQNGVVGGRNRDVGVGVLCNAGIMALRGTDDHGEEGLIDGFFSLNVYPHHLHPAFSVFCHHLDHLPDTPMTIAGPVEPVEALLNA